MEIPEDNNLSNQEQFRIKKLKWKRVRVLSRYFWSVENQINKYVDNTRKLQKTTECCKKVKEYIKESLMTYPDSWEYWYPA